MRRFLKTALALSDIAYDALLEPGINISPLPIWKRRRCRALGRSEKPGDHANPEDVSFARKFNSQSPATPKEQRKAK